MKDLPLYFVSGLPRSGSTLLMNLLGQCPNHHVTPTNDLVELIVTLRNTWQNHISFKAQGLKTVEPRIVDAMKSLTWGFYSKEFLDGKAVFDKSRGWIANIELMEDILQRPIKVIVTVRDIKAIVSSFEMKHRENHLTKPSASGNAYYDLQTIGGRARQLLHIKSVAGLSIARTRDALDRGVADRLIIVPYKDLTTNTQVVMDQLHDQINLPRFNYNAKNVQQVTEEDDTVHGMELHKIKNVIEYKDYDYNKILTPQVCEWLDREYADINKLAGE